MTEIRSRPGSSALTDLKGNQVKCGNCVPNALPPQRVPARAARPSASSHLASGGLQFTLRTSPATCHRPPPGPLRELTRLGCCRTLRAPSTPPLGGAGQVAPGAGRPSLPPRATGGAPGRSRRRCSQGPVSRPGLCRSHLSRPLQVCSPPFGSLRPPPPTTSPGPHRPPPPLPPGQRLQRSWCPSPTPSRPRADPLLPLPLPSEGASPGLSSNRIQLEELASGSSAHGPDKPTQP